MSPPQCLLQSHFQGYHLLLYVHQFYLSCILLNTNGPSYLSLGLQSAAEIDLVCDENRNIPIRGCSQPPTRNEAVLGY